MDDIGAVLTTPFSQCKKPTNPFPAPYFEIVHLT